MYLLWSCIFNGCGIFSAYDILVVRVFSVVMVFSMEMVCLEIMVFLVVDVHLVGIISTSCHDIFLVEMVFSSHSIVCGHDNF